MIFKKKDDPLFLMTSNPQIAKSQIESKRDQSFSTSKYTFWDIDFRQVIKK